MDLVDLSLRFAKRYLGCYNLHTSFGERENKRDSQPFCKRGYALIVLLYKYTIIKINYLYKLNISYKVNQVKKKL